MMMAPFLLDCACPGDSVGPSRGSTAFRFLYYDTPRSLGEGGVAVYEDSLEPEGDLNRHAAMGLRCRPWMAPRMILQQTSGSIHPVRVACCSIWGAGPSGAHGGGFVRGQYLSTS